MKKLLTLFMVLLCTALTHAQTYQFYYDGSNEKFDPAGFFTKSEKFNKNAKYTGTIILADGTSHTCTNGLKMEGTTDLGFSTDRGATVIIVQSTASNGGNTIKFDGNELDGGIENPEGFATARVFTVENVQAGDHHVTRGGAEAGILYVCVTLDELKGEQLATPEITFIETTGEVTIAPVANATKVVYTTDGTMPTDESTEYTAPFTVSDGTVVKALAIGDGDAYANSSVAEVTVLLVGQTVEAPTFAQFNGTFSISTSTLLASCEYSLDGGDNWIAYTHPITLFENKTVKARATRENWTTSDVTEFEVEALPALAANTKTVYLGAGAFDIVAASSDKGGVLKGIADSEADGYSIEIMAAGKGWAKDSKTVTIADGVERTAFYGSNGAQNTIYLPEGVKAYRVTFYSYMPGLGRTSGWNEVAGETYNQYNDIPLLSQDPANPDIRVFDLGEEGVTGSFTFAQTGERPNFVMALEIEEAPEKTTVPESLLSWNVASTALKIGEEFIAPVLNNPDALPVTFSSDNEEVATVDATGVITLAGGLGTAIISATYDGEAENAEYLTTTVSTSIMVTESDAVMTWNFTDWSPETKANLLAGSNWSDDEKNNGNTVDNKCLWQVSATDDISINKYVRANGAEIKELGGLIYNNTANRSLAIALDYQTPDVESAFGPYEGASYLWLGSANDYFTIPNVPAGATIKMGVESHKITDARGVELSINGTKLTAPDGSTVATPKTYTEQEWLVPSDAAATNDVTIKPTKGCHIYFITVTPYEPLKYADYTLRYVDADDKSIKEDVTKSGINGKLVDVAPSDKADITITDGNGATTYKYVEDNSKDMTVAKEGTVVTLKYVALAKYTLSATANPEEAGSVTIAPQAETYNDGTEVKLTATAVEGYGFVNWTDAEGNVISEKAEFTYTVTANAALTANFQKGIEKTATTALWGMDSAEGYENPSELTEGVFSVASFDLNGLTNKGIGTVKWNSNSFTKLNPQIDENNNITNNVVIWNLKPKKGLTFVPTTISAFIAKFGTDGGNFTVTAKTAEGESISLGSYSPIRDNNVNTVEEPNLKIELTESQQKQLATTEGFSLEVALDGLAYNKQGGFSQVSINGYVYGEVEKVPEYSVTLTAKPEKGGELSIKPAADQYEEGSTVTIATTENFGYKFVNWTNADNNVVSTDPEFEFIINREENLTANFTEVQTYSLTAEVSDGANGYMIEYSPAPTIVDGKNMYETGTEVTLKALSNKVLTFKGWSDGQTAAEIKVIMDSNKELTANYDALDYIAGWDFYLKGGSDRAADFANEYNSEATLTMRNADGETSGWLDKSQEAAGGYEGRPAAVNWRMTGLGDYYWQTKVNTANLANIKVATAMTYNYNAYTKQNVEYSLDGESWTTAGTITIDGAKKWKDAEISLPKEADNQPELYIRWIADKTSEIGGTKSDNDGTALGASFIYGEPIIDVTGITINGTEGKLESLTIVMGDEYQLEATVTPENATYKTVTWTSDNEDVATVDAEGNVTAVSVGKATITAQAGEKTATCAVKVYPQKGDATWNGAITITDAIDITNYVVERKSAADGWDKDEWTKFYMKGVDVNEDSSVSFADAAATVTLTLYQPTPESTQSRIAAPYDDTMDALVIGSVSETSGMFTIPVGLDNSMAYVALQADIILPEGMTVDVKAGERVAGSHSMQTRKFSDNHIRVAIYTFSGNAFADSDAPMFEIVTDSNISDTDDIVITNILASDADANEYVLGARTGNTSAVAMIGLDANAPVKVFDINGVYVSDTMEGLQQGFYIVRQGNNAKKVRIR